MSLDQHVDTRTRRHGHRGGGDGRPARVVRRRVRLRHCAGTPTSPCWTRWAAAASGSSSPGTSRPRRTPPTATPGRPASPACCWCTSGPGMTNAVTGVLTAALDSVPLVAIAGDIPSYYYGRHPHQEVNLHADADQTAIYRPFVKRAWQVHRVAGPGPVHRARLLDGDLRAARARCCSACRWTTSPGRSRRTPRPPTRSRSRHGPACRPTSPTASPTLLVAAERPLVYLGGGLRRGPGLTALRRLDRAPRHPGRPLADGQGHPARRAIRCCSACPASGAWS